MPPVIINSTYSIILVWTLNGADWALNTLNAQLPGPESVNQALADAWAGDLAAAHTSSGLAAVQPASVELDRVQLRDLRVANQPLISSQIDSPGTGVGELLPRAAGVRVTARTALAGRSFRGGPTIPGFLETMNEAGGTIAAAASAAADSFVEAIRTSATARAHALAVASPKLGISTPITATLVRDNVWDIQRRRGYNGI